MGCIFSKQPEPTAIALPSTYVMPPNVQEGYGYELKPEEITALTKTRNLR